MHKRRISLFIRLALVPIALFLGIGLCLAQMGGGKSPAQTGPYRSPQNPYLKMRSMTMAQRKAAAQRNATRVAAYKKTHGNPKGEVTK